MEPRSLTREPRRRPFCALAEEGILINFASGGGSRAHYESQGLVLAAFPTGKQWEENRKVPRPFARELDVPPPTFSLKYSMQSGYF
jgi:hypothetical protein